MNAVELRREGFRIYSFASPMAREEFVIMLINDTGTTQEVRKFEEVIGRHTIFFLAAKRTDLTLKQRLPDYPKGD